MDFSLLYQIKNRSLWIDVFFYVSIAFLIAIAFTYSLFAYKYYIQSQEANEMDQKIAFYGTPEQKAQEKEVLDYKEKIDTFIEIVGNRKISSNVLAFVEQNTLPNVWFSSFGLAESSGEIRLSGKTDNLKTMSRQVEVLEKNKDYVKSVNTLNLLAEADGSVKFVFNLILMPKVFGDFTAVLRP